MRQELGRVDSGFHSSLNLVHVNMLNTMTSLHEQVHELRGEVSALRAQLEAGSALQRSLRRTVSLPKRVVRRLLGR